MRNMKQILKCITILLATTSLLTAAQAAENDQPEEFATQLVEAALPKDMTVAGMANSGSLGVAIFLLCEVGKGMGGDPHDDGQCPN